MKKILTITAICLSFAKIFAQDNAQFTQFHANRLFYNPAATGFSDKFLASLTYRTQWTGSPNTAARPNFMLLNAAQYFADKRSGVGLSIYHATQNVQRDLQVKLSYAYHLQVQEESWLAMGLNVGMFSSGIRDGVPKEGGIRDETYNMSDLGFGVEFYTPELQVGVSAQHIPVVLGSPEARRNRQHTHFYYYGTYFYAVDNEWTVIPSVILRNSSIITNVDAVVRVSYLNMFQLGVSWRRDAVSILMGFSFEDTYSIGYSFDIATMGMRGTRPSHEIVLNYRTQLLNNQDTRLQRLGPSNDF